MLAVMIFTNTNSYWRGGWGVGYGIGIGYGPYWGGYGPYWGGYYPGFYPGLGIYPGYWGSPYYGYRYDEIRKNEKEIKRAKKRKAIAEQRIKDVESGKYQNYKRRD